MEDYRELLCKILKLDLPRLQKDRYSRLVASDILNILLIKKRGRNFALLSTNARNASVGKERKRLYLDLLKCMSLSSRTFKKNLLIWNPANKLAERVHMSTDIGKLLGYFQPFPDGWEDESTRYEASLSLQFVEKDTGLQLFGQKILSDRLNRNKLHRYIKLHLKKLDRTLHDFGLKAVAVLE